MCSTGLLVLELGWQVLGVVWVARHYISCAGGGALRAVLGQSRPNSLLLLLISILLLCTLTHPSTVTPARSLGQ